MKEIDCRGMACPQPVVTTKQALDQLKENELTIIVDNPSSSENVERFARSRLFDPAVSKTRQAYIHWNYYRDMQKLDSKA